MALSCIGLSIGVLPFLLFGEGEIESILESAILYGDITAILISITSVIAFILVGLFFTFAFLASALSVVQNHYKNTLSSTSFLFHIGWGIRNTWKIIVYHILAIQYFILPIAIIAIGVAISIVTSGMDILSGGLFILAALTAIYSFARLSFMYAFFTENPNDSLSKRLKKAYASTKSMWWKALLSIIGIIIIISILSMVLNIGSMAVGIFFPSVSLIAIFLFAVLPNLFNYSTAVFSYALYKESFPETIEKQQ